MNMMMFTIKEITGGRADARNIQFKTMADAPVICVPIPSGLNTSSNQQAWGRADISGVMLKWLVLRLVNQSSLALPM